MPDLDDEGIRAELDKICQQVDAIMKRVEELYPPENRVPDPSPPCTPESSDNSREGSA